MSDRPADAPASNAFPHVRPKGRGSRPGRRLPGAVAEAGPPAADRPAHYRLSGETWAVILQEYVEGATVPELASKWRVSEHAVRKRITLAGMTKRAHGDRLAAEQAAARAGEIEAARTDSPEARAGRLFLEIPGEDVAAAADPQRLAWLATLASGRAMTGRLWAEAKALAGLAESYARLGDKQAAAGGGSIETMDLGLLLEVAMDIDGKVVARFDRSRPCLPSDERYRDLYWDWQTRVHSAVQKNMWELMLRAVSAEKKLREMGHPEPRINLTDIDIEAWAREWMSGPPNEANVHERTKIGAWPWR